MTSTIRTRALAGMLAAAGCFGLANSDAQAQPNTYADFPYNQGSLFYRYGGHGAAKTKPKRAVAPRRVVTPPASYRGYAPVPQQAVAPYRYTYAPQAGYYYYAPPQYPAVAPQPVYGR